MDERWRRLGALLVDYSAGVQPGERVMIAMHEVETLPLVAAVYEAVVAAGGHAQVQFFADRLRGALLRSGSPEQIAWLPEIEAHGMAWADVYFGLRGMGDPAALDGISAERLAAHQRVQGQISTLRWQQTRWCLVRVPTPALATAAGMDLAALVDMFLAACLCDWPAEAQRWHAIAAVLEQGRVLHLVAPGTDLTVPVAGRKWLVGDGHLNLPDGEIYTAPIAGAIDGYITFEWPAVFGGRVVSGIRLAWQAGRLVSATADENEAYLQAVLATDEGAGRVGEFAFGVNDALDRPCRDFLLDEKIGGTVHLALGRAYPACGGDNRSAIHWDIVKDTRRAGTVTLDGRPIFTVGRFLV